jgi:hypothetical protein
MARLCHERTAVEINLREYRKWLNRAIFECRTILLLRHGMKIRLNRAVVWKSIFDLIFSHANFLCGDCFCIPSVA